MDIFYKSFFFFCKKYGGDGGLRLISPLSFSKFFCLLIFQSIFLPKNIRLKNKLSDYE